MLSQISPAGSDTDSESVQAWIKFHPATCFGSLAHRHRQIWLWKPHSTPMFQCCVACYLCSLLFKEIQLSLRSSFSGSTYYMLHDPSKIGSTLPSCAHERYCNVDNVQTDLAHPRAWKDISNIIPNKDPLASKIWEAFEYNQSLFSSLRSGSHCPFCMASGWVGVKMCLGPGLAWPSASLSTGPPCLWVAWTSKTQVRLILLG